jgi:predicted ATPase
MAVTAALGQARLLERDSVLEELRLALAEAAGGRGRLVLVAGEAGVGKTAIAERKLDAQSRGEAVAEARRLALL